MCGPGKNCLIGRCVRDAGSFAITACVRTVLVMLPGSTFYSQSLFILYFFHDMFIECFSYCFFYKKGVHLHLRLNLLNLFQLAVKILQPGQARQNYVPILRIKND